MMGMHIPIGPAMGAAGMMGPAMGMMGGGDKVETLIEFPINGLNLTPFV